MSTTNPYEDAARQRKVTALVAALTANGFTADEVAAFTREQREMAERAAGVKACSPDKTWPLVVDAMRAHARAALHVPADPFAAFA